MVDHRKGGRSNKPIPERGAGGSDREGSLAWAKGSHRRSTRRRLVDLGKGGLRKTLREGNPRAGATDLRRDPAKEDTPFPVNGRKMDLLRMAHSRMGGKAAKGNTREEPCLRR